MVLFVRLIGTLGVGMKPWTVCLTSLDLEHILDKMHVGHKVNWCYVDAMKCVQSNDNMVLLQPDLNRYYKRSRLLAAFEPHKAVSVLVYRFNQVKKQCFPR